MKYAIDQITEETKIGIQLNEERMDKLRFTGVTAK